MSTRARGRDVCVIARRPQRRPRRQARFGERMTQAMTSLRRAQAENIREQNVRREGKIADDVFNEQSGGGSRRTRQ